MATGCHIRRALPLGKSSEIRFTDGSFRTRCRGRIREGAAAPGAAAAVRDHGDAARPARAPAGRRPPDRAERRRRSQDRANRYMPGGAGSGRGIAIIAVLVIAGWLLSGFYTVQPNEVGVRMIFGKVQDITGPGFNWNLP